MSEAIIVFNAGSTSVKFGAYEVAGKGTLTPISQGEVSDMRPTHSSLRRTRPVNRWRHTISARAARSTTAPRSILSSPGSRRASRA